MGKHKRQDSDSDEEESTSPVAKKSKVKAKHSLEEETPSRRLVIFSLRRLLLIFSDLPDLHMHLSQEPLRIQYIWTIVLKH